MPRVARKKEREAPSSDHSKGVGELWVVATPIGNLEDLTPRAIEAFSHCDAVLCEDTRRTLPLLSHLGISRSLERCDAHVEDFQISRWVDRLREGSRFALVSDAGTPGVSDPGARLVAAARAAGVRVTPLPGASAVAALVSVLGAVDRAEEQDSSYGFFGFFPREKDAQKKLLEAIQGHRLVTPRRWIWFESPKRIASSLRFCVDVIAPSVARCVVAKELTKLHERIWDGDLLSVLRKVEQEIESEGELGEWCFALITKPFSEFEISKSSISVDESTDWIRTLQCLLQANVAGSEASRIVSQEFGVKKRDVYERALLLSGKKA